MSRHEKVVGALFAGVVVLLVALALVTVSKGRHADRAGCERMNVLRVNQARLLRDQIRQSEANLRGSLGPLERFRRQAEDAVEVRKAALGRLRESVKDHPVRGQPYKIDCSAAYP